MKAIILNYIDKNVLVAEIPNKAVESDDFREQIEKIEQYLSEELGFYLDEINYMLAEDDEQVEVYRYGMTTESELVATL